MKAFNVMCKPIGATCNLNCRYCYYLEKQALYAGTPLSRMSDEVLELFIRQYIQEQDAPIVQFCWQGGEPTLLGLEFFEKILRLQEKYIAGTQKKVENALQTNGTLLDDRWCDFLAKNDFLVGISIDGPQDCHDANRRSRNGEPSWQKVMAGIEALQRHNVNFNTLSVVGAHNVRKPLEVYEFLRGIGSRFIQFLPLVERPAAPEDAPMRFAQSPDLAGGKLGGQIVTPWSVMPEDYGKFLCDIYDTWIKRDVGETFVQIFDVALCAWCGLPPGLCVFNETCGQALALEHNGDIYACDHFVYPKYKLGNLLNGDHLGDLAGTQKMKAFGEIKKNALPRVCRKCNVRFACHGECPKHRFMFSPDGEPGLNYLCSAYKMFFNHVAPTMKKMKNLIAEGRAPAEIMKQ
ncbi:MAG: anaerobic sulfatase maturase [Opitutales bacterium]|nr:anaerobic sulfatase maturase [Opitutales bacterium]